jgi:hypothetical protein
MKLYWGLEIYLHAFLTLVLDGGEWSASRTGHFTPRESPWYPLDRRFGGPSNRSGRGGKEKNSQPLPGIEPPDHPAHSPCVTIINFCRVS